MTVWFYVKLTVWFGFSTKWKKSNWKKNEDAILHYIADKKSSLHTIFHSKIKNFNFKECTNILLFYFHLNKKKHFIKNTNSLWINLVKKVFLLFCFVYKHKWMHRFINKNPNEIIHKNISNNSDQLLQLVFFVQNHTQNQEQV